MSRKARNIKDLQRRQPSRSPYDRVLIVCEGGKTEPNYFRALTLALRLNTANIEVDGSSGSSPRSVVIYAKKRYNEDLKQNGSGNGFDRVYCVFDQDEHPTYSEALSLIRTDQNNIFYGITSVPCFEFWLLLHFTFTTRPIARTGERSPGDVTKDELKKFLPMYEKGDKDIYTKIKEYTDIAIQRAYKANEAAGKVNTNNPSTLVHTLVEYLRRLMHKYSPTI